MTTPRLRQTSAPRGDDRHVPVAMASEQQKKKLFVGNNLTATYQAKTTTTYRAKYNGDEWYLGATAAKVL